MTTDQPRAIVRDDRALVLVPKPLRVAAFTEGGGSWSDEQTKDVELHLSPEDYVALSRQMPGPVTAFLAWIISLDDLEGPGADDRRIVTMTKIIKGAKTAMGVADE